MRTLRLSLFCLIAIACLSSAYSASTIYGNDTNSSSETSSELDIPKLGGGTVGLSEILRLLRTLLKLIQPREEVDFYLYTPLNPKDPQYLHTDDTKSVIESHFNSSLPTTFTIHGWMSDGQQEVNTLIRDAYLSRGPRNIIVLDWVSESVDAYTNAIKDVPKMGRKLGKFIDFMVKNGWLKPQKLTLIGHSLGAHIAGIAARSLKSGRVHRIVALDPAQPAFSYETSKHRLRSTDAYYVESIQTTAGSLGYMRPIGKAAFYPNGGLMQPGCGADLMKSCGHFRSYVYYAEAIRKGGFPSIKCDSYADAINMDCGNQISSTVRMGDPKNADVASGVFFVPIYPNAPHSYSSEI